MKRRLMWVALAAVVVLLVGAAYFWFVMSEMRERERQLGAPIAELAAAATSAGPANATADPGPPVPPTPDAALSPPSRRRAEWYAATTVGAYDAAGSKDPRWDDDARAVLTAAARRWGNHPRRGGDEDDIVRDRGQTAMRAGCDDPLVIYALARSSATAGEDPDELADLYRRSADGFRKHTKYPAVRRATTILRAGQVAGDRAVVDEALGLFPEAFADPGLPVEALTDLVELAGETSIALDGDRAPLSKRVIAMMQESPLSKSAVLTARGRANISYAWDARGDGLADTVTDEGWRLLRSRLALARRQLEEAWALDNGNADAATHMLTVELGATTGRAAMEQWFRRATEADPDGPLAYRAKLIWLEPKWHGSVKEMVAFGRECAAGGRWSGLVPLTLADAHWVAACYTPEGMTFDPDPSYFANNPAVWAELKAVYDRYLREPDVSNYNRGRYAVVAAYSGKWATADRLFRSIKGGARGRVLRDGRTLQTLQSDAAKLADDSPE